MPVSALETRMSNFLPTPTYHQNTHRPDHRTRDTYPFLESHSRPIYTHQYTNTLRPTNCLTDLNHDASYSPQTAVVDNSENERRARARRRPATPPLVRRSECCRWLDSLERRRVARAPINKPAPLLASLMR